MSRKTYFGNTVESAMALARREMGEEVWLVSARKANQQESGWGAYAIEVASEGEPQAAAADAAEPAPKAAGASIASELAELRQEVARLEQTMASNTMLAAPARLMPPVWARQHIRLRAAGLPAELASEWIVLAQDRAGLNADPAAAGATLRSVIGERLACADPNAGSRRRVIALVGPPGAGKTTLLVKLAWRLGLEASLAAAIVSTDTQRIAAAEQLRSYASLMGVPFRIADSPWSFRAAMTDFARSNLVLVDTPGLGAREADALALAAESCPSEMAVETHLVLTAQASTADQWNAVVRYAPFQPDFLAFTRLDETVTPGGLAAVAVRARLPVSFLSFGQSIPEDFETADPARLCDWIFGDVRLPGAGEAVRGAAA